MDAAEVARVEQVIRPYVRLTPVVAIDRAELGLSPGPLTLKLEQLQHSGSFKARGAFANLLLRDLPEAGVVAASGEITAQRLPMLQGYSACLPAYTCPKFRRRRRSTESAVTVP